ncbi:hypothetical protein Asi02nite_24210 [Asanoa siamensis]|uniref:Uncharacterized protein n=1 Tax=Asanoa siamensis TaxID=926357 RepID=A0ABQ4CNM0_9ACTN|nr:hypothetical protein Asi02nite_24210 [Asanoa siamensis]
MPGAGHVPSTDHSARHDAEPARAAEARTSARTHCSTPRGPPCGTDHNARHDAEPARAAEARTSARTHCSTRRGPPRGTDRSTRRRPPTRTGGI